MIGENSKEHWNNLMKTGMLLCPVCRNKVIPKCGTKKTWHFAHQSDAQCAGNHEAETNYHLLGKKSLYQWLKRNKEIPILEYYLRDIVQRPDLFLPFKKHALEFQCATMNDELFKSRIDGYQSIHIGSDWIFGMKRIKKITDFLYSIQSVDLTAAKKDDRGRLFLNYFCPLQQQFLLLRNILPISQRKAAAIGYTFSAKNLKDTEMLFSTFSDENISIRQTMWNKQKTTWRMTAFKNVSPVCMYVKKAMYVNHRSLTLFSPLAGMPTASYYHFETSPFIWQTYLLLLIDQLQTSTFTLNQLITECKRLISIQIFKERNFPYLKENYSSAIQGYLSYLESEEIIKKVDDCLYIKVSAIPYPKTLEEALQQDKIFSKKAVFFDFV